MEWLEGLLKLLFGQLGVVGTVCFLWAFYLGWLYDLERKDHKASRDTLRELSQTQAGMNLKVIEVLTELRTLISFGRTESEGKHDTNRPGRK